MCEKQLESNQNQELNASPLYRIIQGEAGIQRSKEWLEFKANKLGASQAPAIAGKDPYCTPLQLFEKIINLEETVVTPAMERGTEQEPYALEWFNRFVQRNFEPKVIQSVQFPFLMASLDGFYIEDGKPTGCEIKTVGMEDYFIGLDGRVPEKHLWQIYHQMLLTGAKDWYYVPWNGDGEGIVVPVHRYDDGPFLKLLNDLLDFQRRLVNLDPPEAQEKDWKSFGPENWVYMEELAFQYKNLSAIEEKAKKEKAEIRAELISEASKVHTRVKIGNVLKIQKISAKGRVDYDAIPEMQGVNLDLYRKAPTVSWRLD